MVTDVTSKEKAVQVLRLFKRLLAVCLALFCLTYLVPVTAAAAAPQPGELRLTIHQGFTSTGSATPPTETFSYRLAPEATSNPTPAGMGVDYTFTIMGTDEIDIGPFYFNQEGIYRYELRHITATATGYTFDKEVYTVEVHVSRDLKVVAVAYQSNGFKATSLSFNHSFTGNATPPVTPPAETGNPPVVVQVPVPSPGLVTNPVTAPLQPYDGPVSAPEETIKELGPLVFEPLEGGTVISINLLGLEIPLYGGHQFWGLLNLLVCLGGGVLTLVVLLRALFAARAENRKRASRSGRLSGDAYVAHSAEEEAKHYQLEKRWQVWLSIAIAATAVGIFLLVVTQDFSKEMALADNWTLFNVALFVLVIAAILRARKQTASLAKLDKLGTNLA